MENKILFLINEGVSQNKIEDELIEQIAMTKSIFCSIYEELLSRLSNENSQFFIRMIMKLILQINAMYSVLYEASAGKDKEQGAVFILNPELTREELNNYLTESIYDLSSMSYLSSNDLLVDKLSDHLVNTLSVVSKCAKKMVTLIDTLNLMSYREVMTT